VGMSNGLRRAIHRHLSVDQRFGLRLGVGLAGTLVASVTFALLLLLVRAGWGPLRALDSSAAETFNRINADRPELAKTAEVVSDVFDPNVFRVVLTVIAVVYVINGERHHATWLLVTVFGGAALGFALKQIVGRSRPVLPDPVSTAPGLSFPSGHALGASIGCCLLLLITLRFLSRRGRVVAVIAAALIVGAVALARVVLGVHFVSDVLAGVALGIGWVAVTTSAYVAWRRDTGQPVERPAEVGTPEQPAAQR
jgi:membrane-associated phospholipid phosphatase